MIIYYFVFCGQLEFDGGCVVYYLGFIVQVHNEEKQRKGIC